MGEYSISELRQKLHASGELMVVLESDREYELHIHDTEFDNVEDIITTEGMDNGEYKVVDFPASAVEHVYTHKAN